MVNNLANDQIVPSLRLAAFMRAVIAVNEPQWEQLRALMVEALRPMDPDTLGRNGEDILNQDYRD